MPVVREFVTLALPNNSLERAPAGVGGKSSLIRRRRSARNRDASRPANGINVYLAFSKNSAGAEICGQILPA